jgi:hypothetical protein
MIGFARVLQEYVTSTTMSLSDWRVKILKILPLQFIVASIYEFNYTVIIILDGNF